MVANLTAGRRQRSSARWSPAAAVVAEGVETEEQLGFLASEDCNDGPRRNTFAAAG